MKLPGFGGALNEFRSPQGTGQNRPSKRGWITGLVVRCPTAISSAHIFRAISFQDSESVLCLFLQIDRAFGGTPDQRKERLKQFPPSLRPDRSLAQAAATPWASAARAARALVAETLQKLRKGGVKPLKSLVRTNLCAGAPGSPQRLMQGRTSLFYAPPGTKNEA